MAKYIGFSTVNIDGPRKPQINTGADGGTGSITNPIIVGKKFRLTDSNLVIQDLVNALNIIQGSIPGRPDVGTNLWAYIFEPNTYDTKTQIEAEIRRIIALDPRLIVNSVNAYPEEHGILLEVEVAVSPFNDPIQLAILFDQRANRASLL